MDCDNFSDKTIADTFLSIPNDDTQNKKTLI